ncbi:glycosyltransferase family 4 protein [Flavobacterium sp. LB2P74]|uniref:glycosyltransferase family 4 protein n=1 Tax=Flavobacterium sp. LB2P74 TaxID=3401717 RepID=UPI003AB0C078
MKQKKYRLIVFFIPYHHIGGAERVHVNIIKALKKKPIVFFDYSNSDKISEEFSENAHCFLINSNKRRKFAIRFLQIISCFLPVILFGCNSGLFYVFVSKLKGKIKAVDLTHAFSSPEHGMEISSLPYVNMLDKRIVINNKTFNDYKVLYQKNAIEESLLDRFKIISNGIAIKDFDDCQIDSRFSNFTIGFVGRNSPEKRPELFFEVVQQTKIKALAIGDNFKNFKIDFPEVDYFENCNDLEIIRKQFSGISLLIVPSSREGFPLVIMEAMELGIPVIATDVGSIREHVNNDENGYLSAVDKEVFLSFTIAKIKTIIEDKKLYRNLSLKAREHAEQNFDIKNFNKQYHELFYE